MKWLLALLIATIPLALNAWAEDAKPPVDLSAYLEQLQVKLDHAAQRANQPSADGSSVVGLRGSKQESGSKQLYWKGKAGAAAATTDEVKEFRAAVELARAGKNAEAASGLKAFLEKYPKSAYKSDAEESLKRISATAPTPTAVKP